jgi:DNA-binding CsgD family transcriptional regulator
MDTLEKLSRHDDSFFRSILDNLPAFIIINQIEDINDFTKSFNYYSSPLVLDYVGFTQEEIWDMGFRYFVEVMYPEDGQIIREAIEKLMKDPGGHYGGFIRIKSKEGIYQWFLAVVKLHAMKDGFPHQVLIAGLSFNDLADTRFQISALIKENARLRDELLIHSLTRREREIMKMISNGMVNKEIASHLNISAKTVKTHRDNIYRKLGFKNTAALVHFVLSNNLA